MKIMEFNKKYNRDEFVNFLQYSFLPDDFIPETSEMETKTSCRLIQSITNPNDIFLEIQSIQKESEQIILYFEHI